MATRDPRIDAYIEKAAPFAKPILTHLRSVVHEACPDVQETTKWSSPHFDYRGMMCGMAAFKEHCAFGFTAALKKNGKALATYEGFTPSHQREYLEWITEAKGEDTRERRLATAIEWMAEGKPRNWKYMKS